MKNSKNVEVGDSANVTKLLNEIQKEQDKIARCEGDIVAAHVRLARRLHELRQLANGDWGKQLKKINMNPRVASRYLKIGKHWQDEISLKESDLLQCLPTDLLKLEWLCRPSIDQLSNLLNELDCKKATRSKVISAVREALGEEPLGQRDADVEQFAERCVQRLARSVIKLFEEFASDEQLENACKRLETGLARVQEELGKRHRADAV
jgi:hypothetical protein